MDRFSDNFPPVMVQVAGVKSLEEAKMLASVGTDLIGFPLRLPVNEVDTTEAEAKSIINEITTPSCLICYLDQPKEIVDFCKYLGVSIVQLHGSIKREALIELRRSAPELLVIKSLILGRDPFESTLQEMESLSAYVDAFITDTYNPATKAEGATGLTHDWSLSQRLVEMSERPILLAGGLDPHNLLEAIQTVQPAGVDAHTRLENEFGDKDEALCRAFVQIAKKIAP